MFGGSTAESGLFYLFKKYSVEILQGDIIFGKKNAFVVQQ